MFGFCDHCTKFQAACCSSGVLEGIIATFPASSNGTFVLWQVCKTDLVATPLFTNLTQNDNAATVPGCVMPGMDMFPPADICHGKNCQPALHPAVAPKLIAPYV